MKTYIYDGPVLSFGTCVYKKWHGKTVASSEKKAKSNLSYQYKKQFGLLPFAKIELPEKLRVEE